jgi:hypothetical protein
MDINSLNKESLIMIEKMASRILEFAADANKELDQIETNQQNKKLELENKLNLIKIQGEQLKHYATTKYRLELKMQELKQKVHDLK